MFFTYSNQVFRKDVYILGNCKLDKCKVKGSLTVMGGLFAKNCDLQKVQVSSDSCIVDSKFKKITLLDSVVSSKNPINGTVNISETEVYLKDIKHDKVKVEAKKIFIKNTKIKNIV